MKKKAKFRKKKGTVITSGAFHFSGINKSRQNILEQKNLSISSIVTKHLPSGKSAMQNSISLITPEK